MANKELVEIREEKDRDILVLNIKGRLDAITSAKAEKKVFEWINAGHQKLLMDFSQIEYLSSAGMRMLLSTSKKLKSSSGKLVLCFVAPDVMDVLKMSGFDDVIEIANSRKEGLTYF